MIRSMTAFSLEEIHSRQGTLTWEIRSVNHRFLDINLHLPPEFREQENNFREHVRGQLKRGKVDAILRYTPGEASASQIQINEPLARALIIACRQIETITDNAEPLKTVDILQWPGVTVDPKPETDVLFSMSKTLLATTVQKLIANREREGKILAGFVDHRCDQIAELVMQVRKRRPAIIKALRNKILKKIDELEIAPDNNRLEQELVILAQRLDVDEELDRIMAHLDEINSVLDYDEPVGRRLDFLMQELNREANTLAAKSNDATTTQIAVDLKVLIEQMREQIQNIE